MHSGILGDGHEGVKAGQRLPAVQVLLLALLLLGAGCAHRVTDFTVISTKNVALQVQKGKRVRGSDCGMFSQDLKQAIDEAIESAEGKGDMLVDGVVTMKGYFFVSCIAVEGNIASSAPRAAETTTPEPSEAASEEPPPKPKPKTRRR